MINVIFYKNLISRFTLLFIQQFSILLSVVIVALRVDLYSLGLISVYLIIFQISNLLTDWGYTIYSIYSVKKNKFFLKNNYYTIFFSRLFFLFICLICIILFFYINKSYRISTLSILFLIFSISFVAFSPQCYLQALSKIDILIKPTILSRFFFLAIVFFFVKQDSLEYFFFAHFISFFFPIIIGNYYIIKNEKPNLNFSIKKIFILKKKTLGIFFSTLIQNQVFYLWGLFLIFFSNPLQVAYFGFADQILRAGNAIGSILQEIFMSIKNKTNSNIYFKNFLNLNLLLFFLSVMGILFAESVINFIFNAKFLGATSMIKFIILSWFFLTLSKIVSYPIANNFSGIKLFNNISYYMLFLNVFFIFINLLFFKIDAFNASIFFLIIVILNLIFNVLLIFNNKIFFFNAKYS